MRNSAPLPIGRKLEILQAMIEKAVAGLEDEDSAFRPSVADLIRLLQMETEMAEKLVPQKTVIQWIDPYWNDPNPEPRENPPKAD